MIPGSNEHKDVNIVIASMPTRKKDSVVKLAIDMHEAVRHRAGLEPRWSEMSQSLRDHYLRMAVEFDGRRGAFFGTC